MSEKRIRLPKDKEGTIKLLLRSDEGGGFFRNQADIITFAAALGYKKGKRISFTESLEPIRQEVFNKRGHDTLIYLIAITSTNDPAILSDSDSEESRRLTIFEEFANGGLEILRNELKGISDPLDHILLMIKQEHNGTDADESEFDLSKFI